MSWWSPTSSSTSRRAPSTGPLPLAQAVKRARVACPSLATKRVSPHVTRHTRSAASSRTPAPRTSSFMDGRADGLPPHPPRHRAGRRPRRFRAERGARAHHRHTPRTARIVRASVLVVRELGFRDVLDPRMKVEGLGWGPSPAAVGAWPGRVGGTAGRNALGSRGRHILPLHSMTGAEAGPGRGDAAPRGSRAGLPAPRGARVAVPRPSSGRGPPESRPRARRVSRPTRPESAGRSSPGA